jgi:hypothetical protein
MRLHSGSSGNEKAILFFYLEKIKELPNRVMARELFESKIYF